MVTLKLTSGDLVTLKLTARRPAPEVTWWRGSRLLANRSITLGHQEEPPTPHAMNHALVGVGVGVRQVRTEVNIPALTRDYIHANLTCRATNNNITEPLSTTMALLLYLRPTSVSISEPASPLVEGQEARLECVALGAYPAADLSWSLTPTHATSPITLPSASRHLGQKTSSLARVTPTADDHLATLTCSAHNPNITGRPITTSILLHVVCEY
ncbi:synaptogenesis protein syg-2-like [Cherax quadricarinatus]|uniref:synaptogenesis protein syg-2-like n=1 Tax=Cherax quadricarinatus TaxID=27406 RepID=UPI00387E7D8D